MTSHPNTWYSILVGIISNKSQVDIWYYRGFPQNKSLFIELTPLEEETSDRLEAEEHFDRVAVSIRLSVYVLIAEYLPEEGLAYL